MHAGQLISDLGLGVAIELVIYFTLTRVFKLAGKPAAAVVGMIVILSYVPWGIIHWPGPDVFAIHLAIYLTLAYALGMIGARVGKGWHWAPTIIVAFFVGVVTINIIFVTVAMRVFPLEMQKRIINEAIGMRDLPAFVRDSIPPIPRKTQEERIATA